MRILVSILTATLISFIAGCANKDTIIPTPAQHMKTIYKNHTGGTGKGKLLDSRSVLRRPLENQDVSLSNYVRTEKNQLEAKFQLIPNPTLYMFVAPHLASASEVPIPGYLTEFKMWETDHYALPGEVSDMDNRFPEE